MVYNYNKFNFAAADNDVEFWMGDPVVDKFTFFS